MVRRDCSSVSGLATPAFLDMSRQPPERLQLGVRQLSFRLRVNTSAARRRVVAPPARLVVGRMDERAIYDQLAQITEHGRSLRERWGRDVHPLTTPLVTGEVVAGAGELRILIARPQQFHGGQPVQRMLEPPPAVERPLPVIAPEAAGLVVENE